MATLARCRGLAKRAKRFAVIFVSVDPSATPRRSCPPM
ncbi:MAG: hypothetical protein IPN63_02840 [Gammaproteobacteria bacterium]|nr:hypothetical protein [Gammaproteobacteria bacterium]